MSRDPENVYESNDNDKRESKFTYDEMRVINAITRKWMVDKDKGTFTVNKHAKVIGVQANVFTRTRENIAKYGVPFRQRPTLAEREPFEDRARNERHLKLIRNEVAIWLPEKEAPVKTEVDDILKTAGDVSAKRRRLLEIARNAPNESVRIQAELAEDRLARAHAEVDKGPGDPLTVSDQVKRLSLLMSACGLDITVEAATKAFGSVLTIERAKVTLGKPEEPGNAP